MLIDHLCWLALFLPLLNLVWLSSCKLFCKSSILNYFWILSYWNYWWLQQLYQKALAIKSAIPHPRIMGIIRECGGKMHMAERQWAEAATDFFEAFKNYDEAGNQRRIQCLKYGYLSFHLLLIKLLMISMDSVGIIFIYPIGWLILKQVWLAFSGEKWVSLDNL